MIHYFNLRITVEITIGMGLLHKTEGNKRINQHKKD